MSMFIDLKNKLNCPKQNCKTIKSLYEVEAFLRRLSYIKNSVCFAKKTKKLINKSKNIKF